MSQRPQTIYPGGTIGVLGGGQLGRMLGLAVKRLGYRLHVLEPMTDSPAGQVADHVVEASFDDLEAAERFAKHVDALTFEFENVPARTLELVNGICPTHPSPHVLDTCRHRRKEKTFLSEAGLAVAPFRVCHSSDDVEQAARDVGLPGILKTVEFGYDGKGQFKLDTFEQAAEAWKTLGTAEAVYEAFVPFIKEISVVAARDIAGQVVTYDIAENDHANHILDVTTVPGDVPETTAEAAKALAVSVMQHLDVVGVLAVEMFVVPQDFGVGSIGGEGQRLLINELAPRPHNSGHFTIDACVCDQFEQQLRTVAGQPLGDVSMRCGGAAMANLLGDLWFDAGGAMFSPDWSLVLDIPDVKLHVYGKSEARHGRKMGHLTATAATPAQARAKVIDARERLAAQCRD